MAAAVWFLRAHIKTCACESFVFIVSSKTICFGDKSSNKLVVRCVMTVCKVHLVCVLILLLIFFCCMLLGVVQGWGGRVLCPRVRRPPVAARKKRLAGWNFGSVQSHDIYTTSNVMYMLE